MHKAVRLLFLFALLAPLWISGRAAPVQIDVHVATSPADIDIRILNGATTVSTVPAATPSFFALSDAGRPPLPARVVSVLIPNGQRFAGVTAASSATRTLARAATLAMASPASPAPGEPAPASPAPGPVVAPDDGGRAFPSELVRYLGTGTWHGYAIASFAVFPVRVVDGDVVLHSDISLTVDTAPDAEPPAIRPLRASVRRVTDIEESVRRLVANDDALASYPAIHAEELRGPLVTSAVPSLEGSPVDFVIVVPAALAAPFDSLADWKTAKGVPTVVRTVEWIEANYRRGIDRAETIRFFLQDAYAKWGVRWALLVGDSQEIPPRYLYSTYYYGGTLIPCDLYFSNLDGNFNADRDGVFGEQPADAPDLYMEVSVGRLPVSTLGDAATMIHKIMNYETPANTEYTDRVLFLAEVLFPSPWSPPAPIQLNGADVGEYVYILDVGASWRRVTRSYETPAPYQGAVQESRAAAIDSLEAGFNMVFHIGHGYRFNMHCGDDNIAIPDADNLHHPDRFFNLFMLNCTAAAFDFDCLGERLLRNAGGGAVSVIGAVNSAFAEVSQYYIEQYADQVFHAAEPAHIGDAFAASRLSRTPLASLGDNADLWTHYIYTMLADPEMPLWTGPVRTPVVTHPSSLAAGAATITVEVTVESLPETGATVCLWKAGEDYQVATTNGLGQAAFNFAAATAGNVRVVVTGRNLVRYDGSIEITPATDPLPVIDGLAIDDDNSGGTQGNGDGIVDAGETVDILPTIHNTGGTALPPLTATISSTAPFVTVVASAVSAAALAPDASAPADGAWRVQVDASASDEAVAEFAVAMDGGGPTWDGSFSKVVHAPVLEVTLLRKSDAVPDGNGDGTFTNGEYFRLYTGVKNYGTGAANGLTLQLTALTGGATVLVGDASLPDLAPLGEMESTPGFLLYESNVGIENPLEVAITDSYGRVVTHSAELRTPLPPAIQSFDASVGVDKMLVRWNPSVSTDVTGYRVYRSNSASGPFARASADVVAHTRFTDAGLMPSTRYYFAVAALDDARNESVLSPVASASTNPPQLTGWPNTLADASANSPAIGDIDGDGHLEIVVGNDLLYVFRDDGSEERDGDGQPITWGVFSTLGEDFIGPAALAKLDADMGLDIVAAAYTSKQVFCFNANGSVLPGWPRPTIDLVRAGVAVGDVDGDGSPEIFAVDQDAYLYAWHADGSEVIDGDSNPTTQGVFKHLPDTNQWQYQMPALADIDADGKDEVIIPTQDMKLYVLNQSGGNEPGWPRPLPNYAGGGVAVGDIDGNGDLEIVVTVRNSGEIYALHHDNTQMWLRWLPQNLFFNPSPALADITGDGKLEVLVPSSNGRLYAIMYNGADAPGWPVVYSTKTYTESSPVVGDVDGDGLVDVLLGDEATFINGWRSSGAPLDGFPLVTKDAVRGTPAITDLDRDGNVDVVAVGYDRTVYVWDLPSAYDPAKMPWPMFHANVHRNGRYGFVVPTGVGDGPPPAPDAALRLEQNHPNPFNPTTSISYEIPVGSARKVSLVVYDVTGARVRTLKDGPLPAGRHAATWDGKNDAGAPVGSGVYFYRLAIPGQVLTRKMVLLK